MISQMQWAGYGAALAVVGLILIWQGTLESKSRTLLRRHGRACPGHPRLPA
jgi:hypothetical protein